MFETKVVYLINCFPASTPTNTSLTFICSPPLPSPLLLLDFATGTTIYIAWKRCGRGRQNEDSLLLLQQVDSGPPTLKEIYSFIIISFLYFFSLLSFFHFLLTVSFSLSPAPCSLFFVLCSPLPAARCPLPAPRSPFPVPRSPFPVP